MWSKLMDVKNGYVARVWKDLYDAEGVALRIVPPLPSARAAKGRAAPLTPGASRGRSGCRTRRRT